ncbi:uncharacterized protein LOC114910602 isoform X2 [Scleropages formosus]|uniref:uncharacterized protein LOC114910602 isoform X2 n=1 Tax=Scleropages formosus TaxID=113540 RepID=UPI0010FA851D|nr:uncharacterized protein LOC114910602 isoform X2 [Scleropages formosus]
MFGGACPPALRRSLDQPAVPQGQRGDRGVTGPSGTGARGAQKAERGRRLERGGGGCGGGSGSSDTLQFLVSVRALNVGALPWSRGRIAAPHPSPDTFLHPVQGEEFQLGEREREPRFHMDESFMGASGVAPLLAYAEHAVGLLADTLRSRLTHSLAGGRLRAHRPRAPGWPWSQTPRAYPSSSPEATSRQAAPHVDLASFLHCCPGRLWDPGT